MIAILSKLFLLGVLFIAGLEVSLRLVPVEWLPVHWAYKIQDKKIHCWHQETHTIRLCPDSRETLISPLSYEFRVTVDSKGDRITSIPNGHYNSRVWVIGDSLSMGFGVNDEESFPYLLSENGIPVRNLASDSMGSVDILKIYEHELKKVQRPDAILWIFSRSDFLDDVQGVSYGRFVLGKILYIANILRGELERYRLSRDSNDYKEFLEEEYIEPEENHPTLVAIRRIAEISHASSIRPIVLLVPDWNPALDKPVLNTEYFIFVRRIFQESGFEIIDFTNLYKELDGEVLWIPGDGHPNADAQKLFARASERFLKSSLSKK